MDLNSSPARTDADVSCNPEYSCSGLAFATRFLPLLTHRRIEESSGGGLRHHAAYYLRCISMETGWASSAVLCFLHLHISSAEQSSHKKESRQETTVRLHMPAYIKSGVHTRACPSRRASLVPYHLMPLSQWDFNLPYEPALLACEVHLCPLRAFLPECLGTRKET